MSGVEFVGSFYNLGAAEEGEMFRNGSCSTPGFRYFPQPGQVKHSTRGAGCAVRVTVPSDHGL